MGCRLKYDTKTLCLNTLHILCVRFRIQLGLPVDTLCTKDQGALTLPDLRRARRSPGIRLVNIQRVAALLVDSYFP